MGDIPVIGAVITAVAAHQLEKPLEDWIHSLKHPDGVPQNHNISPELLELDMIRLQLVRLNRHFQNEKSYGPKWTAVQLQPYPGQPVKVAYEGRRHWALWLQAATNVQLTGMGIGSLTLALTPGFSSFDLPEGTEFILPSPATTPVQALVFVGDYVPSSEF